MKANKSLTKRFKVTKKGKVIYRPAGQDHFRSKKTGQFKRHKRGEKQLTQTIARQIKKLIHK